MDKISLTRLADEQLELARNASSGRASKTVYGGHTQSLRQTVIALVGGEQLHEHENPGEATVLVLQGRVELAAGQAVSTGVTGDLLVVPDARHALAAVDDSVVVLTVARRL
jgi:quercetin dioxygenase-like cupin family protein